MHELNHGEVFYFLYVCSNGMSREMFMLPFLFKYICCAPGEVEGLEGINPFLEAAKWPDWIWTGAKWQHVLQTRVRGPYASHQESLLEKQGGCGSGRCSISADVVDVQ